MKYLKYIILLSLIVICSCDNNAFIGKAEIDPKIKILAGDITVTYKLGDLLILDEWSSSNLNAAEIIHLIGDPEVFQLTVSAGNVWGVTFNYVVDGSIKIKTNPVDWETILNHINDFDVVMWSVKDGKDIKVTNQVPVVNKEKIQEPNPEAKGSTL